MRSCILIFLLHVNNVFFGAVEHSWWGTAGECLDHLTLLPFRLKDQLSGSMNSECCLYRSSTMVRTLSFHIASNWCWWFFCPQSVEMVGRMRRGSAAKRCFRLGSSNRCSRSVKYGPELNSKKLNWLGLNESIQLDFTKNSKLSWSQEPVTKWPFHGVDNFHRRFYKTRAVLIIMVHRLYFEIAIKG